MRINRQGLLQSEAAFDRAVIQILDKVIPLLVFNRSIVEGRRPGHIAITKIAGFFSSPTHPAPAAKSLP